MKKIGSLIVMLMTFIVSATALAADVAAGSTGGDTTFKAALAIASGLCIAIASHGGALGQGRAAAAAMEGIARNPEASTRIMTQLIISLALIESLVIYALVIAFMLEGKI